MPIVALSINGVGAECKTRSALSCMIHYFISCFDIFIFVQFIGTFLLCNYSNASFFLNWLKMYNKYHILFTNYVHLLCTVYRSCQWQLWHTEVSEFISMSIDLLIFTCIYVCVYIYRVIQEESALLCEMIV